MRTTWIQETIKDYDCRQVDLNVVTEIIADAVYSKNEFTSLYVIFLYEASRNNVLKQVYTKIEDECCDIIWALIRDLNIEVLKSLSKKSIRFMSALINKEILGCELLGKRTDFYSRKKLFINMMKNYISNETGLCK